jgi:hypothetical protein
MSREVTTSNKVVLRAVEPGPHEISLKGQKADASAAVANAAVVVAPGAIATVAISLV